MKIDADRAIAHRGDPFEDDLYQRPSDDRQQRLGQVVRDRPEPLAESGCGKKNVDREFGHYKIFFSRRGAETRRINPQDR